MAYLGKYPKFYPKYLWALIAITLIHACGVKKNIPQNRYLLKRNSVVVPKKTVSTSEIKEQILHNPNKRVLFNKLPVFLWAYSLGTSLKHPELNDSIAWRKKLRNKLGEPPVLVDTALAAVSAENISNHLFNLGYFDNRVSYILTIGKHKAEVDYIVEPGKAYRLNSFFREPADTALKPLIDTLVSQNQAYRLWWPVNLNALNDAKDELAIELRDRGYYDASPDLFRYEIDTLADKKEGAVFLKLNNPLNQTKFQRYKFGATYLNIICSDIYLENQWPQSYSSKGKHFQLNHYPIKGNIMEQVVSIDSGNWFSQSVTNQTYVALVEMGLFSYVDLHQEVDTTNHLIITKIEAKAIPRIYTQIEPQALYSPQGSSGTNFQTQSQRSFGLAGIVSLNNRNAMGNGESLKISSVTSYEAIFKRGDNNNIRYGLQQGFNARLSLPNFSLLDKIKVKNSYQRRTPYSHSVINSKTTPISNEAPCPPRFHFNTPDPI